MRATLCIQARIGQPQPLNRAPMHKMLVNDLFHISRMNKPIPNRIRIDHDNRPMFALVKTAQLVSAYLALQSGVLYRVLESRLQLPAMLPAAAWPRSTLVPLVSANKNVMPELCQSESPSHNPFASGTTKSFLCDAPAFLRQYLSNAT